MEHDSPEALKKYLQEHPGADRSIHKVKKSPQRQSPEDDATGWDDEHGYKDDGYFHLEQAWQENTRKPGGTAVSSLIDKVKKGKGITDDQLDDAMEEAKGHTRTEGALRTLKQKLDSAHELEQASTGKGGAVRSVVDLLRKGRKPSNSLIDEAIGQASGHGATTRALNSVKKLSR